MGAWLWLTVAGLFEVVWVVLLKQSDGFRVLPMGTVYAVWTGIGAAGGLAWGILLEGEPAGVVRIGCVMLILAGVAGLRLGG